MRGRGRSVDLLFDPDIERTARANQKVIRLSNYVPPGPRTRYTSPSPLNLNQSLLLNLVTWEINNRDRS